MANQAKLNLEHRHPAVEFSPTAIRYLRAARWSPDRIMLTTACEAAYREEGLSLHPAAMRFLQEFGDLIIKYQTAKEQADVLEFRAQDAIRGMGNGGLAQLEKLLGVRSLCPIGHYQYGTCLLLLAADGKVFGVSDDTVTCIGKSGEEAVNNILNGHEVELIHSDVTRKVTQPSH